MLDVGLWALFISRISAFLELKTQMPFLGINQAAVNTHKRVNGVSVAEDII